MNFGANRITRTFLTSALLALGADMCLAQGVSNPFASRRAVVRVAPPVPTLAPVLTPPGPLTQDEPSAPPRAEIEAAEVVAPSAFHASQKAANCGMAFTGKASFKVGAEKQELTVKLKPAVGPACISAASSEEEWVFAEVGSLRDQVTVAVHQNEGDEPREAVVVLVAGPQILKVQVWQDKAKPKVAP